MRAIRFVFKNKGGKMKETKEAVVGIMEIAIVIAKALKDGAQISDAVTVYQNLFSNEEMKEKVMAAFKDINKVPEEIKDASLVEASELAIVAVSYIPKLVEALKK